MLNRTYVTAASAAMALAMAAFAVNTPEVEPNDAKATATLVTMAAGDTFSGNTISGTTTGLDYFLVRLPADGVLTRYQLDLTTVGAAGHTMSIRGLNVSGGVVGTTDTTFQTATIITAGSARRSVFYGTGSAGNRDIYVRVAGTATTTGDYSVVLSSSAVTETAAGGGGTVVAGNITLGEGTGSTADHDWWVYDSSLGAIPGFDQDDPDSGRTLAFAVGTYHVAWGNFNTANNLASTGGTFLTGAVLDFPNVVANTSTTSITNINMGITSAVGNVQVPMTRTTTTGVSGQFDVNWVALTVDPAVNPSGTGLATPSTVIGDGTGSTLFTVNVLPGSLPPSTGLAVTTDLSAVGGSATQAFFDDGTNGDVTGGDNIFSFFYNVPVTGGGNFSLPFTVTDAQARSGSGNIALNVVAAPAVFTDLGTLTYSSTPVNSVGTVAAGGITWFRFNLPLGVSDPTDFLDIWTDVTVNPGPTDTEIGVYDSLGNLMDSDDDDGNAAFSALSYGLVTPTRPLTGGAAFNGRDGALTPGIYWIAAGQFNTTFGTTGWGATSAGATAGDINLNLVYNSAGAITANPTITGTSDTPDPTLSGTPVLFTATVVQGLPASAISSVTGDFSAVGGTATEAFNDSGTGGDVTAGDGIWSLTFSPTGAPGTTNILVTATDGLSRTATANIAHAISGGSSGLPATFTDLGTLSFSATPVVHAQSYAAGDVKWYRFVLSAPVADPNEFLDLWTSAGAAPGTLTDTEVGLYDNAGNLIVADDDDGDGLYSAESYGAVLPNRPAVGTSTAFNGRDGALAAGTYWLAVSEFSTTHNATNWEVLIPAPADAGDVQINLVYNTPNPTNPTGVGASTPNAGLGDGTFSPLFTVVTTPGQIPTSTGITVTADLSGIGGSATQSFFDDGTNGDVTGGDGTYSFSFTIPNGTAAASYPINFTVADAESRSSTGSFSVTVVGEPTATDLCRVFDPEFKGLLINDLAYTPGQTIWYTFQIPGPGASAAGLTYLDITTVGSVLTGDTFADDTEIAVFDTAGNVVDGDDDDGPGFMSQLSWGDTTPRAADGDGVAAAGQDGDLAAGTYFLAVSSFNITPAAPWVAISDSTATGTIDVTFRTNIAGCIADVDDGTASGVMDGGVTIDDLLFYLAIFNTGNVCADVDDGTATGVRDGGVTIDDLLYYLSRFNGGC